METRSRLSRRAWFVMATLFALYWIAIFTGTHLPETGPIGESINDKVMHFGAYGGLAFLAMAAWGAQRLERRTGGDSPETWKQYAARYFLQRVPLINYVVVGTLAAFYGTVDEVSQKYVGRTCDRYDWLADAAGTITALIAFAVVMFSGRRRFAPYGEVSTTASSAARERV